MQPRYFALTHDAPDTPSEFNADGFRTLGFRFAEFDMFLWISGTDAFAYWRNPAGGAPQRSSTSDCPMHLPRDLRLRPDAARTIAEVVRAGEAWVGPQEACARGNPGMATTTNTTTHANNLMQRGRTALDLRVDGRWHHFETMTKTGTMAEPLYRFLRDTTVPDANGAPRKMRWCVAWREDPAAVAAASNPVQPAPAALSAASTPAWLGIEEFAADWRTDVADLLADAAARNIRVHVLAKGWRIEWGNWERPPSERPYCVPRPGPSANAFWASAGSPKPVRGHVRLWKRDVDALMRQGFVDIVEVGGPPEREDWDVFPEARDLVCGTLVEPPSVRIEVKHLLVGPTAQAWIAAACGGKPASPVTN